MTGLDLRAARPEAFPFRTAVRSLFEDAPHKAFLFCLEGTLLSERPEVACERDTEMPTLLAALAEASGGAVAVLGDRSFAEIDRQLAPLVLPGCASGGLEIRSARGVVTRLRHAADLDPVRRLLARPGLLPAGVEIVDDELSIDLRHGGDVSLASATRIVAREAVALAPAVITLRAGATSTRIGFAGASRGQAVHRLMNDAFFIERIPIVFGGGCDDEDVYAAARCFGGTSIEVGRRADHGADIVLPALNDVRWLMRDFLAELGGA